MYFYAIYGMQQQRTKMQLNSKARFDRAKPIAARIQRRIHRLSWSTFCSVFEMSAISKHMIHTPYKFLGETELLMNYEAQDENKVGHFISFHKHKDAPEQMSALVYNIDFKNKNSHLVMEYQQKLIAQLDAVYGEWSESFETGYNTEGNYEAEWYFEAGVLQVRVGTDFITVDLREH